MMHGHGKSDSSIVRTKPPNEAEPEAKEAGVFGPETRVTNVPGT